ncbi:MAG: histidine kinase [Bacteroidota bacterium]
MEGTTQLSNLVYLLPLLAIIFIVAAGVLMLNLHFQKNLFHQKLMQEEIISNHQKELLRSSIQVQEDERKRIAVDLHDELGAVLSIARMHLVALEQQTRIPEECIGSLKDIRELTETSISSIRRISHELMPQNLQMFGLLETLQHIVSTANNSNGINIRLNCDDKLESLPWSVSLGLYRICLELINNTIKHAQAKHINISIRLDGRQLTLFYVDDGIGITEKELKNGLGQKNIQARAISIGATVNMGNNETGGFYAMLKLPDITII